MIIQNPSPKSPQPKHLCGHASYSWRPWDCPGWLQSQGLIGALELPAPLIAILCEQSSPVTAVSFIAVVAALPPPPERDTVQKDCTFGDSSMLPSSGVFRARGTDVVSVASSITQDGQLGKREPSRLRRFSDAISPANQPDNQSDFASRDTAGNLRSLKLTQMHLKPV